MLLLKAGCGRLINLQRLSVISSINMVLMLLLRVRTETMQTYILKKVHTDKLRDATLRTTLMQLAELMQKAELVISNDTSAVHIGVAVNASVICISNGNTYGRFVPYPVEVYSRIITLFPKEMESEKLSTIQASKKYLHGSEYSISGVSTEQVKEAISTNDGIMRSFFSALGF